MNDVRVEIIRKGSWIQFFTPHGFAWRRFHVPLAGVAKSLHGLRIIHLTDLHFRPYWGKAYDEILQAIRNAKPDLIFITGDFVESKWNRAPALPFVKRFIDGLYRVEKGFLFTRRPGAGINQEEGQDQHDTAAQPPGRPIHQYMHSSLPVASWLISPEFAERFLLHSRHMTLPTITPRGMGNTDFHHRPGAGMAGNTVFPQLQAVRNRRRRTG